MASDHPAKVTGGCLCGTIRYTISFEAEGAWPPIVSTCQCWMCRKWTGCLVAPELFVRKAQVSPSDWKTFETFTEHESSPGNIRAFCSKCGSGIFGFFDDMPEDLAIAVGTIDEEFLMGKVLSETIKETEYGKEFKRGPSFGKELTEPVDAGNIYWQNAIPGITDNLPGPKFLQHYIDKVPLPEAST